ncbi:MAG: KinB sensor domain-containing domain, partial [Pseudomonas sp.]
MKLAMKLRTRLFLSISALITVALLGLSLGLVSVMQMAGSQEALIRSNFITLDLGLKLRQTLGDQLIIMLSEKPDSAAFAASKQHYFELLEQGIAQEPAETGGEYGFRKAKADYERFIQAYEASPDTSNVLSSQSDLTDKFNALRNGLIAEHKRALDNINDT